MISRFALAAGALALAAFALWHPARAPIVESSAATPAPQPSAPAEFGRPRHRRVRPDTGEADLVVYVAGAVKKPGLYHLHPGDRNAQALFLAGGFSADADAVGVNLAQRANDGDEVYVPVAGERTRATSSGRRTRRHSARDLLPSGSIDVNRSDAVELAAVPGIGRAIAQRIVELREREGSFASLDELLDVAGMTESRLDRARPYLRQP